MSEVIKTRIAAKDFRWQLLSTASVLALLTTLHISPAEASDQEDRPVLWVELGGQLDRLDTSQEAFAPNFLNSITQANLRSALDVQKPSIYSIGGEGKISLQPKGSDWIFSVSAMYGRSQGSRHQHQQTKNAYFPIQKFQILPGKYYGGYTAYPAKHAKFADGISHQKENHVILDFQVGKDVGLGLFGNHGTSVLSAGVRIAQFTSRSDVSLHAQPDVHYPVPTKQITSLASFRSQFKYAPATFHGFTGIANAQRDFHGVGPSVSWNASAPIAKISSQGDIALDWGLNAEVLFGRQKASGSHQATARTYHGNGRAGSYGSHPGPNFFGYNKLKQVVWGEVAVLHYRDATNFNRSRMVTVPNLGAMAGLSFRYADAKISFGYRADFFFGAMDGGIDTAHRENVGFYGPFATISIGLGG
jgi:hypothetical protein